MDIEKRLGKPAADAALQFAQWMRGQYDQLGQRVNATAAEIRANGGMASEVKPIKGYRFQVSPDAIGGMDAFINSAMNSISGLTGNPKPTMLERIFTPDEVKRSPQYKRSGSRGYDEVERSAALSFDAYVQQATHVIHMAEPYQRLQGVRDAFATQKLATDIKAAFGEKGVPGLNRPQDSLKRVVDTMTDTLYRMAGSDQLLDQTGLGKKVKGVSSAVTSVVARANLLFKLKAMVSQSGTLPSIISGVGAASFLPTLVKNLLSKTGPVDDIPFLQSMRKEMPLTETTLQAAERKGFEPFRFFDHAMARLAARAVYDQCIERGMSKADALNTADTYARKMVPDRTAWGKATILGTRSTGMFTQYLTDVVNQYQVFDKDIAPGQNRFAKYAELMVYTWAVNELSRIFTGGNVSYDPINAAVYSGQDSSETGNDDIGSVLLNAATAQVKESFSASHAREPAVLSLGREATGLVTGQERTPLEALGKILGSTLPGGSQARITQLGAESSMGYPYRNAFTTEDEKIKALLFGPLATDAGKEYTRNRRRYR